MQTIKKVKVRVRQMESNKRGGGFRAVPNQFIIETSEGEYFQSYNSIIAFMPRAYSTGEKDAHVLLDRKYWDYSKTTGRYRNEFLGDDGIAETRQKIKEGVYVLADLNA